MISDYYIQNHPDFPLYPGIYLSQFEIWAKTEDYYKDPDKWVDKFKILASIYSVQPIIHVIARFNVLYQPDYLSKSHLLSVKYQGYLIGQKNPTYIRKTAYIMGGAALGWMCGRKMYFEALGGLIITFLLVEVLSI